jgi:hypothetical protein
VFVPQNLCLSGPNCMAAAKTRVLNQFFGLLSRLAYLAASDRISFDPFSEFHIHVHEFPSGFFQGPCMTPVIGNDVFFGWSSGHPGEA